MTAEDGLKEGRILLNEEESKAFLMTYGIPTTMVEFAHDPEGAARIAEKLGYPIVIKVVSPDISHKSDVGGVVTGIDSSTALEEAYEKLIERVKKRAPAAAITGVVVQKMFSDIDYELISGARKIRISVPPSSLGWEGPWQSSSKIFRSGFPRSIRTS